MVTAVPGANHLITTAPVHQLLKFCFCLHVFVCSSVTKIMEKMFTSVGIKFSQ